MSRQRTKPKKSDENQVTQPRYSGAAANLQGTRRQYPDRESDWDVNSLCSEQAFARRPFRMLFPERAARKPEKDLRCAVPLPVEKSGALPEG
jgi:hypothetical protein